MTTNRKDVLDAEYMKASTNALLRPGRCDMCIHIRRPTSAQIIETVARIFCSTSSEYDEQEVTVAARRFVALLKEREREYYDGQADASIGESSTDDSSWQCFIGMRQVQDYCIRWTHRKGANALASFLLPENLSKWLTGLHQTARQQVAFQIDKIMDGRKRSVKNV